MINLLLESFKRRMLTLWSVQDDRAYIDETYNRVVWVYACAAKIASCVALPRWNIYKRVGAKLEEARDDRLYDLLNNRISDMFTSQDFFEMWALYLALNGKFFALCDSPIRPAEITVLKPYETQVMPGPTLENKVLGFEYQNEITLDPDMVLWDRFIDPMDFYGGMSPVRAAARTIDTENAAIAWNKDAFDNMGIPPGAIQVRNAPKSLIYKLKERWRKDIAGPKNARMPLVLDTEKLNYINFGLNQVDMDFLEQRKLSRIEICAAFGVPGQVIGDPEGQTYANYEQALTSFWQDTIVPKYLNHIRRSLSFLSAKFDKNLYITYCTEDIPALQESADSVLDRVRALWVDNLITQKEARAELGKEGGEDIYYYQFLSGNTGGGSDDGLE